MALGPISGAAVRLAPPGETVCLCEGIEDGLSVLQATSLPVWAALGTSNLTRVELPEMVREVIVCADADDAGERAALAAAQRFIREGRRAKVARPAAAKDFNAMRM
jgi:DNA primase